MEEKAKSRAFYVSRLAELEAVGRVKDYLVDNLKDKTSFQNFVKNLDKDELLKKAGWEKDGGWYWETVYRTNTMSAFNAGRAEAFDEYEPEFLEFIGIEDFRQTPVCAARSGIVKKRSDPFWRKNFPPLHFNCRSTVRPVYAEEAAAFGIKESENVSLQSKPAKGFGRNPAENWDGVTEEVKRRYERQKAAAEKPASADGYVDALKTYPFFKSVPKELKADFENDLLKVEPEQLSFLVKHAKTMKANLNHRGSGAYYSPAENTIYLNLAKKDPRSIVSGFKTDLNAFLHESGHWLDYNSLGGTKIQDELPELKELVQKDALNYVNQILGDRGRIESFETLNKRRKADREYIDITEKEIAKKSATRNCVSDLINGASNGKIRDGYSHRDGYWIYGALEDEAVAHFFSARGSGGERLEEIKTAFPNAYKYFDAFVRGIK